MGFWVLPLFSDLVGSSYRGPAGVSWPSGAAVSSFGRWGDRQGAAPLLCVWVLSCSLGLWGPVQAELQAEYCHGCCDCGGDSRRGTVARRLRCPFSGCVFLKIGWPGLLGLVQLADFHGEPLGIGLELLE